MLTVFPRSSEHDPDAAVWYDLVNPAEEELRQVEISTGLSLPRARRLARSSGPVGFSARMGR